MPPNQSTEESGRSPQGLWAVAHHSACFLWPRGPMVGRGCIMNPSLQSPCICLGFPISMTSNHVRKTHSPQTSKGRGQPCTRGRWLHLSWPSLTSKSWEVSKAEGTDRHPASPPSSLGCPGARLSVNELAVWPATWHSPFRLEAAKPLCADGETEAQNVEGTGPRPHSKSGMKPELGPPSDLKKTSCPQPRQTLRLC